MTYAELSHAEKVERILKVLPQQKPFRYVDNIDYLDEEKVVGSYTFREDEWFYQGHFPGNPITPGVILLESMAQIGIASLAIHLFFLANRNPEDRITFFQSANVDFLYPVRPGDKVIVKAQKTFFKMGKIKADVQMYLSDETVVAKGTVIGMGVKKG
ncbi:MAG: beta-hydroxyacyl-ACP dehydratase [Bdellovibrionota bacterium]|nr:MAG: beta-hydroxyacyl-ACP dehydratase [Pseudomonadota bacterium]RZA24893.1 MAG: beta-hydroxyacyl-ACP dehydratase [Pseudomonadota bacterium]